MGKISDLDNLEAVSAQYAVCRGPVESEAELVGAMAAAYRDAWLASEVSAGTRHSFDIATSDDLQRRSRMLARELAGELASKVDLSDPREHVSAVRQAHLRGTLDQRSEVAR